MKKESRHGPEEVEETFAPISVAADGGIAAGLGMIGEPAAALPLDPTTFVCLRGPCRYYWHLVTLANEGNPKDTWEHLGINTPRQHSHTCLVNPGFETDLNEDNVFECSRWDPIEKQSLIQIKIRRDAYFKQNPEHDDA